MGRRRVPVAEQRIKCHVGNCMVPAYVYATLGEVAGREGITIREAIERALVEFARRQARRRN